MKDYADKDWLRSSKWRDRFTYLMAFLLVTMPAWLTGLMGDF
jgi:hypothetical protein